MKFVLFSILVLPALTFGASFGAPKPIKWPTNFTVTGRIILPYADIVEPFNVSMTEKKGYYDFYNGTVTIYYREDEKNYGNVYKIVYVTMNDTYNKKTCFKLPGSKAAPVTVQDILPNISQFQHVSDSVLINGEDCMFYQSSLTVGQRLSTYSLYIKKSTKTPYLLSFIGFDRLLGSHFDEYDIFYDNFIAKTLDEKVFDVPAADKCGDFPGPGDNTHLSDNLFHELIGSRHDHIDNSFNEFKYKYNRKYHDEREHANRRKQFHQNYRFVHSKNRQPLTYKLALNHLADLSQDEIKIMRGYRSTGFNSKFVYKPTLQVQDLPTEVNWWLNGAVTPVKDQGICGSCWSFGTTGTLEGSLFIKTGRRVSLSEQAFVDCSWGQGNNGCDGGESERAFEWMLKNGCLPTEASYGQYMMQDGMCHAKDAICGVNITMYMNTESGDVNGLREAIALNGPVSVAIDASQRSFSFYDYGVYYDEHCGNKVMDLDHQVLAVGYGTQNGRTYWLVKNSWSTHWGMNGYVLMSDKHNNCGVATDASFAKVA